MVLLIPEVAFIVLVVLGAIGVVSLILSFLLMGVAAIPIYKIIFKRKKSWIHDRTIPDYDDEVDKAMYEEGKAWLDTHKDIWEEVEVQNDGLMLRGIYLNFGREHTLVVISGRKGTAWFMSYYGQIYEDSDYNVLLIDSRGNGWSEGEYLTAGVKESGDLLAWCKYLHDERGQKGIIMHGICIGGATAMLLTAREDCPDYMLGVIAEGPFTTILNLFVNHLKTAHAPYWPMHHLIGKCFKRYAGVDVIKDSPINRAQDMHKPILIMQGMKDNFARMPQTKELFDKIASEDKEFFLMPEGDHSHMMYYNREMYVNKCKEFVKRLEN